MTTILTPPGTGPGETGSPEVAHHSGHPSGHPSSSGRRSARRRLAVCVAIVVAALGWVAVRGLTGSFVYYLTPTDVVVDHQAQVDQRIRLGGFVVPGSVHRPADTLTFVMTDGDTAIPVRSTGPVPQMFRAGQGVVVEGALGKDGAFHSDTLLVKHDGEYRAPTQGKLRGGR